MLKHQLKFWILAAIVAVGAVVAVGMLYPTQSQTMMALPTSGQIGLAHFSEGLAAVRVDGKWGYADRTGKLVIPAQFTWANDFSEGLARVSLDKKVGFINKTGAVVVPLQYDVYDLPEHFSEGLAPLRQNGKWGYVDRAGQFAIPSTFASDRWDGATAFSEGLSVMPVGEKYGLIDKTGRWVIPPQFDKIGTFSEGLIAVRRGTTSGFSDRTGKIVFTLEEFPFSRKFSEGLVNITNRQKKAGYYDRTGRLKIPFKFDYAEEFVGDRAVVGIGRSKDGYIKKFGFIDKTGRLVIPAKFNFADAFHEELAAVQVGTLLKDEAGDRRGYINSSGQFVFSHSKEPLSPL